MAWEPLMRKVLIIKLRYIGDTLTLLPVVRAIKSHEPEAHVSVMIYKGTEGILSYQKEIDEMILLDRGEIKKNSLLKRIRYNVQTLIRVYRERFDWVIDLTSSDRTSLISWFSRAPLRVGAPLNNPLERFAYHELIEADLTQDILGAAIEVHRALGTWLTRICVSSLHVPRARPAKDSFPLGSRVASQLQRCPAQLRLSN